MGIVNIQFIIDYIEGIEVGQTTTMSAENCDKSRG